jgi:hypothetical protein
MHVQQGYWASVHQAQKEYWASVHQAQKEFRSKVVPDSPFTWIYKLPLPDGPIEGRGPSRDAARQEFVEKLMRIQGSRPEALPPPSEYDPVRAQLIPDALEFFDVETLKKSAA